jgi:hypothetical protein
MHTFNLDIRDFNFTELLTMPDGHSGQASLRLDIDDRQGPIDVFVGLSRDLTHNGDVTKLRLDFLTTVFSEGAPPSPSASRRRRYI